MKHAPTNINVTVTVSCNFCRMIRTYRSHLRLLRVPVIILFVTISLLLVRTTVFWRVLTIVHYTFDCLVFWLCPLPSIPNRSVSETGSVSIHTQAVGDIPLTLIRLDGEWEHFFFTYGSFSLPVRPLWSFWWQWGTEAGLSLSWSIITSVATTRCALAGRWLQPPVFFWHNI
jgi:hypothetical protein